LNTKAKHPQKPKKKDEALVQVRLAQALFSFLHLPNLPTVPIPNGRKR